MQFNFLTQQIQLLYLGSIEKWRKKKVLLVEKTRS